MEENDNNNNKIEFLEGLYKEIKKKIENQEEGFDNKDLEILHLYENNFLLYRSNKLIENYYISESLLELNNMEYNSPLQREIFSKLAREMITVTLNNQATELDVLSGSYLNAVYLLPNVAIGDVITIEINPLYLYLEYYGHYDRQYFEFKGNYQYEDDRYQLETNRHVNYTITTLEKEIENKFSNQFKGTKVYINIYIFFTPDNEMIQYY